MVSEIENALNYYLPLSAVFQIDSIAKIAQWIREKPVETLSMDDRPQDLCLEDYRALLAYSVGRVGKHVGKRGLILETSPAEMNSTQPFVWIGDINVSKKLGLHRPSYTMPVNSWAPLQSPKNYISAVASLLVDELLSVQPAAPFAIGAYCYEGLVAMEMAQQLQEQGHEVALLALVDKFGPSNLHRIYLRLDWYASVIQSDLFQLSQLSIKHKWQYIKRRIQKKLGYTPNAPQIETNLLAAETITLLDEAANSYIPRVYSGNVILIRSIKSDLDLGGKDLFRFDLPYLFPYFGWEGLLTGKVKSYKIPCKHIEIYVQPHVEELGRILDNCLDAIG
jgi:thioesterase domain-containing protein